MGPCDVNTVGPIVRERGWNLVPEESGGGELHGILVLERDTEGHGIS
jgi:hypothetical protein